MITSHTYTKEFLIFLCNSITLSGIKNPFYVYVRRIEPVEIYFVFCIIYFHYLILLFFVSYREDGFKKVRGEKNVGPEWVEGEKCNNV